MKKNGPMKKMIDKLRYGNLLFGDNTPDDERKVSMPPALGMPYGGNTMSDPTPAKDIYASMPWYQKPATGYADDSIYDKLVERARKQSQLVPEGEYIIPKFYVPETDTWETGQAKRTEPLGKRDAPYVYVASKLVHAEALRKLWVRRNDIKFTSRWVFLEGHVPDDLSHAQGFWADDVTDVLASDALILYAEPGENLRGALFEAGIFYAKRGGEIYVVDALGKPLAGQARDQTNRPNYGTFPALPGFTYVPSIDAALDMIILKKDLTPMGGL